MGGRGMGGGGGGGRGRQGGEGGGGASRARFFALRGGALFAAEATVFANYLAWREGARFVGAALDAQMSGASVDSVFAKAQAIPTTIPQLDAEWRRWMSYEARNVKQR